MELNYASKGVGTAGLTTGIIGTALGAMNVLGGGGLFGLGCGNAGMTMGDVAQVAQAVTGITNRCSDNMPATRYDLQNLKELMAKDQEIAILKSEQNTEVKMADVYERLATRMNAEYKEQQAWNAQQMVNNANISAAIATNASSIAGLQNIVCGITKTIVPKEAICPEYMNRYNSWTAPTD